MSFLSSISNTIKQQQQQQQPPQNQQAQQTQGLPSVQKTAYQQNLSTPAPQKWYKGEYPTSMELYGRIYSLNKTDPAAAAQLNARFMQEQQTKGSNWYAPYNQATNPAVGILQSYGIDTFVLTSDWFAKNTAWQNHLQYGTTTTTPKTPTKNSSPEEIVAFQLYQYQRAEKDTEEAEDQLKALQQEIAYKACRTDRNYSDDYIVDSIDWNKYPKLKNMRESVSSPALLEMNRAIDISDDNLHGMIWAARNGSSGNYQKDIAMSALGEGKTWQDDPELSALLNWNDKNTFSIYQAGMTLDEEVAMYFNRYSFDQQAIDDIRATLDPNDTTAMKMFQKLVSAFDDTQKAKEEKQTLQEQVDKWIAKGYSEKKIQDKLNEIFNGENPDLQVPTLKKMDDSIQDGSATLQSCPVQTTEAIDFSRRDLDSYIHEQTEKEKGKDDAAGVTEKVTSNPIPENVPQDEVDAVTGTAPAKFTETELANEDQVKEDYAAVAPVIAENGTNEERVALQGGKTSLFNKAFEQIVNAKADYAKKLENSVGEIMRGSYIDSMRVGYDYESHQKNRDSLQGQLDEVSKEYDALAERYKKIRTVSEASTEEYSTILNLAKRTGDETWDYYRDILEEGPEDLDTYGQEQYERALLYVYQQSHPGDYGSDMDIILPKAQELWNLYQAINSEGDLTSMTQEEYERTEILEQKVQELKEAVAKEDDYLNANRDAYNKSSRDKIMLGMTAGAMNIMSGAAGGESYQNLIQNMDAVFELTQQPPDPNTTYLPYSFYDMYAESGEISKEQAATMSMNGATDYATTVDALDKVIEEMDKAGIPFSDEERKNLQKNRDTIDQQAKSMAYAGLNANEDFAQKAEEGKKKAESGESGKIAKAVATGNWNLDVVDWVFGLLGGTSNTELFEKSDMESMLQSITEDEKNRFFYLLENDGQKAAEDYFKFIADPDKGELTIRASGDIAERVSEFASQNILAAGLSTVSSFIGKQIGNARATAYRIGNKLTGNESTAYNPAYWESTASTGARQGSKEWLKSVFGENDITDRIYDVLTGIGDITLASKEMKALGSIFEGTKLASGLSEIAKSIGGIKGGKFIVSAIKDAGSILPLSIEASNNTYQKVFAQTKDADKAEQMAGISFVTDLISHTVIMKGMQKAFRANPEQFASKFTTFIQQSVENAGVAGASTFFTEGFQERAEKAILGEMSEWGQVYAKYEAQNYPKSMCEQLTEQEMNKRLWQKVVDSEINAVIRTGAVTIAMEFQNRGGFRELWNETKRTAGAAKNAAVRGFNQLFPEKGDDIVIDASEGQILDAEGNPVEPGIYGYLPGTGESEIGYPEGTDKTLSIINGISGSSNTGAAVGTAAIINSGDPNTDKAVGQEMVVLANGDTKTLAAALNQMVLTTPNPMALNNDLVIASLVKGSGNKALQTIIEKVNNGEKITEDDMTALHNGAMQDKSADPHGGAIIEAVKRSRIANRTNEIVAGQRKILEAAEQKKADAKVSLDQAKKYQETVEGEREAAAESVKQAISDQLADASNDDHNGAVQQTVNHLIGKDDQAINQAAASVANAQQRMDEATQNVQRTTGEVITSAREQATAEVEEQMAQEQQQRDEQQLAKQAEADRLALQNEQEAKQEEESRKQYETKFRTALTKKGFTGESLEKNVQKAVELAMQRERGKIDTSKRLSEEDGDAFLRQVSRQTGMTFSMQDMGDPNVIRGVNRGGSEIILNSRLSKGQALTEAALHETIHGLEQTSVYNQFADTVLSILYGGRGTEAYNRAIQEKVREYGTLGIALSSGQPGEEDNGAEREIVADFARLNMANKKFIRKIVARGAGKEYHKAVSSAANIFKGYRLTGKAKQAANMMRRAEAQVLAAIDEASRMKQEAYDNHTGMNQFSVTSAGNAVGLTIEPNDNGTYQYKIIRSNGEEVKPGSFTADDVKGTPAGKLIDMRGQLLKKQFDNGELTKKQYEQQLAAYEKAAQQMRQFMADIINLIGEAQDAELVWELAGSQAFSVLKANGDKAYGTSEDMGSICVKTRNIINVMSDVMLKLKRGLTKDEIDNIVYKEVARGVQDENGNWKAGVVPCPPCYVFSRWVNRPARIEKVNQFQKECKDWTDEQIQELMDTPEPVGRTKAETVELSGELKQKKLWVSLCLADKHTDPKTKEVTWTRRENPDICPDEILFDLNRSGDMAVQHPGTWKFMQKGGSPIGKAISPYADSRIGESIIGIKTSAAHEKALLEDAQNKGKPGYKQKFHNPFEFNRDGDEEQAFEDYEGAVREIRKQNAKGGQRWQSWGDFRAEWGSDYLMEMMTMQMLGATVQTYTKVPQAIDLFATANFEVNMSLMPDGDGFEHNKDGSIKTDYLGRKVLKFSGVTGIDPKAAYEYTMKYGKKGNVHPMIVGISDDHILACLESDYIGYVIPFHGSGGSVDRLQHLMNQVGQNMDSGFDYTAAQEERFLKTAEVTDPKTGKKKTINPNPIWNLRMAIITGKYESLTEAQKQAVDDNEFLRKLYEDRYLKEDSKLYQVFFTDDEAEKIYPYEYWETEIKNPDGTTRPATLAEADNNGERYVRYCQMMDVEPKFSGLVKNPPNGRKYFTEEEVGGQLVLERDKQGRPTKIAYGNFSGKTVDEKTGEVTYKPVKGYYKVLIDHPMYNRIYDSNENLIKEKSVYREPEAVDVSSIKVGAVPQAVNEYPEVNDAERAELSDRIAGIIYARENGQTEEEEPQQPMNGRTMLAYNAPMQQSEEATTTGEYVEQQKPKAMAIDPEEQASAGGEMSDAEIEDLVSEEEDKKYLAAVESGDMETAKQMVDEKADKYVQEFLLPDDSDEVGFKYHRGPAPTKTFKRYAVLNVTKDGFKAAYAGNKSGTPVGVWLDAQNLESYMSDIVQFDDGSFATYIPGDTGAATKDKFSPEKIAEYGLRGGQSWLLERGGKHSSDVPNFSQMNLKQDENGNKVSSAKDGALPHNKLIFEIEYGISDEGDLTDYVKEHGRMMKGKNQGLANIQPNQYYDFKTNPNAVGKWGIGGTFRILRLVPHDEIVSVTEQYKKDAVESAKSQYENGEISKDDMKKQIKNAESVQVQKWVGGYHPEDFGLSVESVDEMVEKGRHMKITDPVTYDDNGDVIPLSERFNPEVTDNANYSFGGEMSEEELLNLMVDEGIMSPDEIPYMPPVDTTGMKRTQFSSKTVWKSETVSDQTKKYLYDHGLYTPETDEQHLNDAAAWVGSFANGETDPDGYHGAMNAVLDKDFNPFSVEGQARLLTVASMASIKNDKDNEARLFKLVDDSGHDMGAMFQARKLFYILSPGGRKQSLKNWQDSINRDLADKGKKYRVELPDELLEKASNAKTDKEFQDIRREAARIFNQQIPVTWGERIVAWRMLCMLSAPRTHFRNDVGNLMMIPIVGTKNKVGAVLESGAQALGKIDKQDRTKTIGRANPEAKQFARTRADEMESVLNGTSKWKEGDLLQQERKVFGTKNNILSKTVGKLLQKWYDANGNELEWVDMQFMKGHYVRALSGLMTARGLKPEDMKGKTLEEADAYAVEEALKATFRDRSAVASWMNKIKVASKSEDNSKGLAFVQWIVDTNLPFKKTPINIGKRGMEYSAVGLGKSLTYDAKRLKQYSDWKDGKLKSKPKSAISPTEWIDKFSAGLTGVGIMAAGFLASVCGIARGGFKKDDPADQIAKMAGEQEYAIKPGKLPGIRQIADLVGGAVTAIGKNFDPEFEYELLGENVTMSLDWAAPSVLPFFMGVSLNESREENGITIGTALDVVKSMTDPMLNMTVLESVQNMIQTSSYSDEDSIMQLLYNTATNFASSLLPTFVGQVARSIDPKRRTTYTNTPENSLLGSKDLDKFAQQMRNKIPWLSMSGVPYTNDLGESPEKVISPWVENLASPAYFTNVDTSDEMVELGRLYKMTKDKTVLPSVPPKSLTIDKENVNLTGEEYTKLKEDHGKIWRDVVGKLVNDPTYLDAQTSDTSKARMFALADQYATAIAKRNFDKRIKAETWIDNAAQSGDVVGAIIDKVTGDNKEYYVSDKAKSLAGALFTGNKDDIRTYVGELEYANADPSTVRKQLTAYFKPLYREAYENNDEGTMELIKDILFDINDTLDLDKKITKFTEKRDFNKWISGNDDDEDEEDEDYDPTNWLSQ